MTVRTSNWILLGIITGIGTAFLGVTLLGERMVAVEWLGTLFLKALRMIIIPLVMASIIVGITGMGDVRKLGRMGALTALYYAATTSFAVGLGLLMVNLIRPGSGIALDPMGLPEEFAQRKPTGLKDIVLSLFSENIFQAMAEMDILPVIVFSIALAAALTTIGEKGQPVIAFFDGLNEAVMKMVYLLMWFAPLGVFGLVAGRFARVENLSTLVGGLGKYMLTVLIGLAVHGVIVLPLLLWLLGGRRPLGYFGNMATAVLTAFSTASSSATLPLTIEAVERKNKVSRRTAYFVLPV